MVLDPHPVHDYIFIDNVIEGILIACANAKEIKGKTFNLGTGIATPNKRVLEKIEKLTQAPANYSLVKGLRKYDNFIWVATDLSLTKYGWQPKVELEEGLKRIYEYNQQRIKKTYH